jgi:hypothetical protein
LYCDVELQALMALFVLASKDGWVNIMYTGLDAVGIDLQVIEHHSFSFSLPNYAIDERNLTGH